MKKAGLPVIEHTAASFRMGSEPSWALHKHLSSIYFSTVKELLYVLWCGRVQSMMVTLLGPEREISVLEGLLLAEGRRLLASGFQAKFSLRTPLASCVQSSCVLS